MKNVTQVFSKVFAGKKILSFMGNKLASTGDYKTADREGFVFKSLKPLDLIELKEGIFTLDNNLDLVDDESNQVYSIAKGIYEELI
jgi:hypothetical protein